jgi:hypothetical protein
MIHHKNGIWVCDRCNDYIEQNEEFLFVKSTLGLIHEAENGSFLGFMYHNGCFQIQIGHWNYEENK